MRYLVGTEQYGECTVMAETRTKARYQAYLVWYKAYAPNAWQRNPFLEFMKHITFVVPLGD